MNAAYQTFLSLAGVPNDFTFPNIDEFDAANWACAVDGSYSCSAINDTNGGTNPCPA